MEAAAFHVQGLRFGVEDASERARVTASMAKCYFQGVFQAKTRDSFKNRMGQAHAAYEKARELYFDAGRESRRHTSSRFPSRPEEKGRTN